MMRGAVAGSYDIEDAIHQAQHGPNREGGFWQIHEVYFSAVRGLFLRRFFSHSEAEDLTQETFFRVYRRLGDYEHRGYFSAWLFTIADSVCHAEWQKRGTLKRKGVDVVYEETRTQNGDDKAGGAPPPPPPSSPAHQVHDAYNHERRSILSQAVAKLSLRQRQCLELQLEGYSYQEIGTLIQVAPGTVKRHLGAARDSLRSQLGDLDLGPIGDDAC